MAVDPKAFLEVAPKMYLTTWTWQDGKVVKRVPVTELPKRIKELLRFGIDFSVTRYP